RRPWKSIFAVIFFALIAATFFTAACLISGTETSIDTGISRLGADILVVPADFTPEAEAVILTGQPTTFFFENEKIGEIGRVEGVGQTAPQAYIATLSDAPCCSLPVELIGFTPGEDFTITPWLRSSAGRMPGKDEVIVGSRIEGDIGSDLKFYGHDFRISGRLEPTGMGLDSSVFVRMEDAIEMAGESGSRAVQTLDFSTGRISSVLVKVREGEDPVVVASRIQAQVQGTRAITSQYLVQRVAGQISQTVGLLDVLTVVLILIATPFVALTGYIVADERRRQIGMLKLIGGSNAFVFLFVMMETMFLAVIGGAVGILSAFLLISHFHDLVRISLDIPFLPSFLGIAMTALPPLLLAVTAGVIAGIYPAFRSSTREPFEDISGTYE
ncbi:MAG: FtsX-like permease family protein, partial [Methanoregulaceae archaeon]|nr:FtsX-like permease family protein [Methanoregulaceae archaeon]